MSTNPDSVILSSALVTLGSTSAASMLPDKYGGKGEFPPVRLLIGTSLTFTGLSMLGEFAPAVASPIAAAIAMTALTYYGIPIMDNWFNNKHNPVGANAFSPDWKPGTKTAPGVSGKGQRPT